MKQVMIIVLFAISMASCSKEKDIDSAFNCADWKIELILLQEKLQQEKNLQASGLGSNIPGAQSRLDAHKKLDPC